MDPKEDEQVIRPHRSLTSDAYRGLGHKSSNLLLRSIPEIRMAERVLFQRGVAACCVRFDRS
jgi:hypothetical protein